MAGGTLMISKAENLYPFYRRQLEELRFREIIFTAIEKDGLDMLIDELKPDFILIDNDFFQSATPYLVSALLRRKPKLNITILVFNKPVGDIGMWYIANGVKSYIALFDGYDQFLEGLTCVRNGKSYISASAEESMLIRDEQPKHASVITKLHLEIIKLVGCGFTGQDIADTLHISLRNYEYHKAELYNNLCAWNEPDLMRISLTAKLVTLDELNGYGKKYRLNPKPDIDKRKKKNQRMKNKIDINKEDVKLVTMGKIYNFKK